MNGLKYWIFTAIVLASCTIPRKYQKNKPFLVKTSIELKGGAFKSEERNLVKQRLYAQLDDSAKVPENDFLFVLRFINSPAAYDTSYTFNSARNMIGSMLHLGYYQAQDSIKIDTVTRRVFQINHFKPHFEQQSRVSVKYIFEAGNPTLIDTISYNLSNPNLQRLTEAARDKSLLIQSSPVTKTNILGEINRLVELYRNNGYYKFSFDDLKMRGDSSILSLTTISDDPFENIRLLAEANEKRNKPTIKLSLVLNPTADRLRLKQYYINQLFIYPDFAASDTLNDPNHQEIITKKNKYYIRFHKDLFRAGFLDRNMDLKTGDLFRQDNYTKTLNNFSKTGVWQNVNIQTLEVKDSSLLKDSVGRLDMMVQMLPAKKFGFEANIEASYSANSNLNSATTVGTAGKLVGLSTNFSLQNRNLHREGIKMTHAIRAGIELNLNPAGINRSVNSNELSYTNTISFPRLIGPINLLPKSFFNDGRPLSQQTFINFNSSYTKRIDLFSLFSSGLAFGNEWSNKINRKNIIKFPNIEYSLLYNQSDSFKNILQQNPYLRYSYNTALIIGSAYGYSSNFINPNHTNRQRSFRFNVEESGLIWGRLGILKKELRQFIKADVEYTFALSHPKSARIFHAFLGVGVPLDDNDTASLPFFKQYFGGGPNSMRGWPIKGIGPGAKPAALYNSLSLNDRTGDIRFEINTEYRHDLLQIIPNTLLLKWAVFADAGNVWNFRNTHPDLGEDSLQFQVKNFYKQLGVSVGTGFRLDFNFFIIRLDMGFRVKKPDVLKNDGWKIPDVSLKNLFSKDLENKIWRNDNFNFTIGLSYPF